MKKDDISKEKLAAFFPDTTVSDTFDPEPAKSKHTENLYQKKEYEYRNNSYEVENYLLNMVKRGDVEGVEDFINSIPAYHAGTVANDILRMNKNYIITTISLVTRAAIESGIPKAEAFALSDLYITKLEGLSSLSMIDSLTSEMVLDFTNRVKEHRKNSFYPLDIAGLPAAITNCMSYIKANTNQKISVSSVSKELGYDRSYLSDLFSKTLGFSMSAYILRCKLEESKVLLAYTDKSLSEISNYLCFSSQSHFQLRFREAFHITPLKYRQTHTTSLKA